ncbi:response regulator transcription factor [Collinsella sp. An2]|uniref:response regulator transcription factor n=1 Tax=Collinsella sp. An2 TaxID=1965585 RepID=UPI000B36C867|nr:response regulator transcription factor [Collinsella sp. An2]OUP06647.1 DNA-binding response regulator [Collinsella sp. An2]
MPAARILVVEDDADINQIVATRLTRAGYTCTQAFSGSEAKLLLDAGNALPFDLAICDLMLPGLPGEELVRLIRARDAHLPVIVTSARTATADKIDLLTLGADDYLTKPFDLDELVARVAVQLRHAGRGATAAAQDTNASDGTLHFRAWALDPDARTFLADGKPVSLTRIEFNILEILMRQPRRVFSKQELFEQAWGEPYAADDNTLNVHVSNIRSKLRPTGTDGYIKTVWGMGFKLVEA